MSGLVIKLIEIRYIPKHHEDASDGYLLSLPNDLR